MPPFETFSCFGKGDPGTSFGAVPHQRERVTMDASAIGVRSEYINLLELRVVHLALKLFLLEMLLR